MQWLQSYSSFFSPSFTIVLPNDQGGGLPIFNPQPVDQEVIVETVPRNNINYSIFVGGGIMLSKRFGTGLCISYDRYLFELQKNQLLPYRYFGNGEDYRIEALKYNGVSGTIKVYYLVR